MLKLYGAAQSRASIVQWYLEELALPYEFVSLDLKAGEHRQAPFTDINPFGKVPALVDGDLSVWESGAILLYLAEKNGQLADLAQKATISQWVLFGNSTLANGLFIEQFREREMPRLLGVLNAVLEKQDYLLGDAFTVADVAVGSILAYVPIMLKLNFDDYPQVAAYVQRLTSRPAFQKTIGYRPG
ncbi:MAG: glutathione S-transferase family protein [Cyanobacteriota bacterium]|nr:glutathione S-transferase family protein [Cyanobacteriota bacterium]